MAAGAAKHVLIPGGWNGYSGRRTRAIVADDVGIDVTQPIDQAERVIDEIPGAYKDIEKVMEDQNDLVEIKAVLKQVLCVKG